MASEKNPLAEYVTEKTAISAGLQARAVLERFGRNASQFGQNVSHGMGQSLRGDNIGKALGGAAMAGGVGLAGLAAQKVMDAMTKAHDFKQMLAFDQELAVMHEENPGMVNQMFSTLRTMNPGFTKDPVVAAQYVKRMVGAPGTAGGVAAEALDYRDKLRPAVPVGQMMLSGAGARGGAKRGR